LTHAVLCDIARTRHTLHIYASELHASSRTYDNFTDGWLDLSLHTPDAASGTTPTSRDERPTCAANPR
ncbi:unnamed protein product, partial [Ectocarpus sp. 12 AP-2014]